MSTGPMVYIPTDYPVEKLTYGKNKPNANGGFNIELSIGDNTSESLLQTPRMRAPFGISTNKNNLFKKELDISFQGMESNESIKKLRSIIETIDQKAIDYVFGNSKTFFKKELSREVIAEYYTSAIKLSKKEQYADTFKMKLLFLKPDADKGYPDGKFRTTFWNSKGEEQTDNYLDKGDTISCLVKPQMMWVANKQFGITWVCTQVKIVKQPKVSGYAFKKTDDEDAEPKELSSEESEFETEEVEESEEEN
jgi:hypothetical protein